MKKEEQGARLDRRVDPWNSTPEEITPVAPVEKKTSNLSLSLGGKEKNNNVLKYLVFVLVFVEIASLFESLFVK